MIYPCTPFIFLQFMCPGNLSFTNNFPPCNNISSLLWWHVHWRKGGNTCHSNETAAIASDNDPTIQSVPDRPNYLPYNFFSHLRSHFTCTSQYWGPDNCNFHFMPTLFYYIDNPSFSKFCLKIYTRGNILVYMGLFIFSWTIGGGLCMPVSQLHTQLKPFAWF